MTKLTSTIHIIHYDDEYQPRTELRKRLMGKEMFEGRFIHVHEAATRMRFMDELDQHKDYVDVIFLDINDGAGDATFGFSLCEDIRRETHRRPLPIFFLSAYVSDEYEDLSHKPSLGAVACLDKNKMFGDHERLYNRVYNALYNKYGEKIIFEEKKDGKGNVLEGVEISLLDDSIQTLSARPVKLSPQERALFFRLFRNKHSMDKGYLADNLKPGGTVDITNVIRKINESTKGTVLHKTVGSAGEGYVAFSQPKGVATSYKGGD